MMEPKVRQMIVCEDARTRPGAQRKIDVLGLMTKVVAERFPFNLSFAVYLCLTDARGAGEGRIVVRDADGGSVYSGDFHAFEFGTDPLRLHPFMIRVFSCRLPGPGLYLVLFVYNDVELADCPLHVEHSI